VQIRKLLLLGVALAIWAQASLDFCCSGGSERTPDLKIAFTIFAIALAVCIPATAGTVLFDDLGPSDSDSPFKSVPE